MKAPLVPGPFVVSGHDDTGNTRRANLYDVETAQQAEAKFLIDHPGFTITGVEADAKAVKRRI